MHLAGAQFHCDLLEQVTHSTSMDKVQPCQVSASALQSEDIGDLHV